MMLAYFSRGLGLVGVMLAIGACSSDQHKIGNGNGQIGKGANSGSGGSGGEAGSGSGGSAGSDPCAGVSLPPCAPKCAAGFDIAGTKCTPGEECTISNVGDECVCGSDGTWACSVHPPLGTGCNLVCEYAAGLSWYTTCGDPVCQSPDPDDPAIPNCTTEQAGAPCSAQGTSCEVPGDSCGASLLCTDTDPTAAGCPISRARHKDGIAYLDERELQSVHDDFLRMKMARWHYKSEPAGARDHLGFIIDDQPNSPAVMSNGERVDLYGYTSMAAAAIQVQSRQIKELEREIAALKQKLESDCKK